MKPIVANLLCGVAGAFLASLAWLMLAVIVVLLGLPVVDKIEKQSYRQGFDACKKLMEQK